MSEELTSLDDVPRLHGHRSVSWLKRQIRPTQEDGALSYISAPSERIDSAGQSVRPSVHRRIELSSDVVGRRQPLNVAPGTRPRRPLQSDRGPAVVRATTVDGQAEAGDRAR